MQEIDSWIENLEKGVVSSIEVTKSRIYMCRYGNGDDAILHEYDNLYKTLRSLCSDTRDYYSHLIEGLLARKSSADRDGEDLLIYNKAARLEKLIQKITNSMEFIDDCISSELKNDGYIETLSVIWRHS